MKYLVEIILLVVLISLMYYRVNLLTVMASSNLGKLVLVGFVVMLHLVCGTNCSILAALIVIVVLHNKMEGYEDKNPNKNSKKDNKDEDEDEDSDDEDESKTEPSAKEVVKSAKKKQEDDDEDEEKNEENLEVKETFVSMSDLDRLFKTDSIKNTLDSTSEKIKSFM